MNSGLIKGLIPLLTCSDLGLAVTHAWPYLVLVERRREME